MMTTFKTSSPSPNLSVPAAWANGQRQESSKADSRSQTIHLIDADSTELMILFESLTYAGFRVSASSRPEDALVYIARMHPQVVIARMEPENKTGLALLDRVKEASPGTRVILTSGRTDWSLYEEVRKLGGFDLVARPVHILSLLRSVERAIAG